MRSKVEAGQLVPMLSLHFRYIQGKMLKMLTKKTAKESLPELLVRIAQNADEKAFNSLYDACSRQIYSHAFGILRRPEAAEEVLQETMASVWRAADKYNPDKGSPMTWILTICHNKTVDTLRIEERQKRAQHAMEYYEPVKNQISTEPDLSLDIREALAVLSSQQRKLVVMSYFEGKTHEEIAESLHLPLGTVKSQLYAALKVLKTRMER